MEGLTERVRQAALSSGADLVGFAPISRFDNAPPELHPRTIFPQTRTAVVVATRKLRGTLKTVEEGTYWQAYNADSYAYPSWILSIWILRNIINLLEDEGYTGVPIHNPFMERVGRKLRPEHISGPDGHVSLRAVAVAAGLGEFGHSKVVLTPQFGPRQRFFAVFTDAELEPTPLFTDKICDGCLLCLKECEACAIGKEREVKVTIEGVEYSHAPLKEAACSWVHNGRDPRFSPFFDGTEKDGEDPAYNKFLMHSFRVIGICVGRGCLRACVDHLEKTGRIKADYKTPMIERERWKLNSPPPPKASAGESAKS
jgi:ferredoxin